MKSFEGFLNEQVQVKTVSITKKDDDHHHVYSVFDGGKTHKVEFLASSHHNRKELARDIYNIHKARGTLHKMNEEVTAGNGTEVLTESALGTSVGQELKKYLKVAVKIPEPSANGVHKLPLKPDGIHGALCKSYELSIRTSQVSDDENGSYWAYRFDLSWAYKNGGTNGNSICTIWVTDEGKILGSRAASL